MTVLDLITRSLNMIGWLQPSEVPSNAVAQRCLDRATSLLLSYNLDRNKIFTELISTYTMTAAQQTQTIGPGGQFNGPRPTKIRDMNLLLQTNPIVRVLLKAMDAQQFEEDQKVPTIVSIPQKYYYDAGFSQTAPVGLGKIYFYPVPNAIYPVEILQDQALALGAAPVALGSTLLMPDGYDRMIAARLALEIAPEFGRPVTPDLVAIGVEAAALVDGRNAPSPIMKSDPAIGGRRRSGFNYLTGEPY